MSIAGSEEKYARELFRQYYESVQGIAPPAVDAREFGVGSWSKKIAARHLEFRTEADLKQYLVANPPFYISYSTAYYEFPDRRPMKKKNWLGADLIFEFDADHTDVPCIRDGEHSTNWICPKCMHAVKQETIKLIEDFLVPDFGLSKEEILVNFSGQRGYHIHARSEEIRAMNGWARREIADYITGKGLDPGKYFFEQAVPGSRLKKLVGPKPSEKGWGGRIARGVARAIQEKKLEDMGIEKRVANKAYKDEEMILSRIEAGNWDAVKIPHKTEFWSRIIEANKPQQSREIDQAVSFDVSRLIRLPDSLHGSTGLIAKKVGGVSDLDGFDPLTDAVAFGDSPVSVKCSHVPKTYLKGNVFGPFKNEEVELPEYAALFLLCKRVAKLWRK